MIVTHRHRDQRGFTLLEVLVAIVVLGFLVIGLTQGVRAGLALRQAQTNRLGDNADLDSTIRLLRELLTRLPVTPAGNRLLAASDGTRFKGEADRVSFVGDLPTGIGTERRVEATLAVEGNRLVLSWRPHYHSHPLRPPPPLNRAILLDGVRRLELAYWGAFAGSGQPVWQSRWESSEAPQLIRIRLGFAKNDSRQWPALLADPRF